MSRSDIPTPGLSLFFLSVLLRYVFALHCHGLLLRASDSSALPLHILTHSLGSTLDPARLLYHMSLDSLVISHVSRLACYITCLLRYLHSLATPSRSPSISLTLDYLVSHG